MSQQPPQQQAQQPGIEVAMTPQPQAKPRLDKFIGKLTGKVALITGGDSGIGRAVAYAFAQEGASIMLAYLNEQQDALETQRVIREEYGQPCELYAGDLGIEENCQQLVCTMLERFGSLSILVNNAAEQHPQASILDITSAQLERTFRTNIFAYFYLTKAALPYLLKGSSIINTTSVTAYHGNPHLLDYSASKGAIVAFTRSLSQALVKQEIRVNGVAPGPIWTPLIPSTFDAEKVAHFGEQVPMQRAGQPAEVASCYVFLASSDASYLTGQILHPNGGVIVNG